MEATTKPYRKRCNKCTVNIIGLRTLTLVTFKTWNDLSLTFMRNLFEKRKGKTS